MECMISPPWDGLTRFRPNALLRDPIPQQGIVT
jgi:hypothetical protein